MSQTKPTRGRRRSSSLKTIPKKTKKSPITAASGTKSDSNQSSQTELTVGGHVARNNTTTATGPVENYFVKSTAILTEHFGYVPIALIDDIINAANDILYKCTAAMDEFLSSRYPDGKLWLEGGSLPPSKRLKANDGTRKENQDGGIEIDITEEIELGTAKFETLFESIVDKCFDGFELYVLRNLMVIPQNLIQGGWIRLSHHRGVDFVAVKKLVNERQRKAITDGKDTLDLNQDTAKEQGKEDTYSQPSRQLRNRSTPNATPVRKAPTYSTKTPGKIQDPKGPSYENVSADMEAQIASLYKQIRFQQSLNVLLKRQHTRTDHITKNLLEPVEQACRLAFESLLNPAAATIQDASVDNESVPESPTRELPKEAIEAVEPERRRSKRLSQKIEAEQVEKIDIPNIATDISEHSVVSGVDNVDKEKESEKGVIKPASQKVRSAYNSILPFSETISYLNTQVGDLIGNTREIQKIMDSATLTTRPLSQSKSQSQSSSITTAITSTNPDDDIRPTFSVRKTAAQFERDLLVDILVNKAVEDAGIVLTPGNTNDNDHNDKNNNSNNNNDDDDNYDYDANASLASRFAGPGRRVSFTLAAAGTERKRQQHSGNALASGGSDDEMYDDDDDDDDAVDYKHDAELVNELLQEF